VIALASPPGRPKGFQGIAACYDHW